MNTSANQVSKARTADFNVSRGLGFLLMFGASLVAVAIAVWSYLAPLTGVTGSYGAMLVIVSSLLLVADAVILAFLRPGALRGLFLTLGILGAIGTFIAGWFLHGWWLMAAMVVVAAGFVIEIVRAKTATAKGAA